MSLASLQVEKGNDDHTLPRGQDETSLLYPAQNVRWAR